MTAVDRRASAKRLAATIRQQAPAQGLRKVLGLVYAVSAGSAVTVTLPSGNVSMPYIGVTPTVGTLVYVLVGDGSPVCLGNPVGTVAPTPVPVAVELIDGGSASSTY